MYLLCAMVETCIWNGIHMIAVLQMAVLNQDVYVSISTICIIQC